MSISLGKQDSFGIMEPSYIDVLVSSGVVSKCKNKIGVRKIALHAQDRVGPRAIFRIF